MRKVRLSRDRAKGGELRRREAHQIEFGASRVGHIVEYCLFGRSWKGARLAKMLRVHRARFYAAVAASGNAQSIGLRPRLSRNAFVFEKCRQPKKPLCADNGEGCGALRTR